MNVGFTVASGLQLLISGPIYQGNSTLNAGQLNLNNAGALGTGAFTIAGGAIDHTCGSPLTRRGIC
ncbi:MAG: hypothetical protein ACREIC_23740 [Limisphaerales bacterium]